jgi:hypothetical protein
MILTIHLSLVITMQHPDLPPITTPVLQPVEYWAINACLRYYLWRTVEEAMVMLRQFWRDHNIYKVVKKI